MRQSIVLGDRRIPTASAKTDVARGATAGQATGSQLCERRSLTVSWSRPVGMTGRRRARVAANFALPRICQSVAPQRYASSTPLTQARSGVAAAGRSAQRGAEMDERVPTLKFGRSAGELSYR